MARANSRASSNAMRRPASHLMRATSGSRPLRASWTCGETKASHGAGGVFPLASCMAEPAQKARARAHPEMERIARRFAAINGSLAKGVKAGSVTRAQLRSIGRNFAAIGRELQK